MHIEKQPAVSIGLVRKQHVVRNEIKERKTIDGRIVILSTLTAAQIVFLVVKVRSANAPNCQIHPQHVHKAPLGDPQVVDVTQIWSDHGNYILALTIILMILSTNNPIKSLVKFISSITVSINRLFFGLIYILFNPISSLHYVVFKITRNVTTAYQVLNHLTHKTFISPVQKIIPDVTHVETIIEQAELVRATLKMFIALRKEASALGIYLTPNNNDSFTVEGFPTPIKITVNENQAAYIYQLIQSMRNQTVPNVEFEVPFFSSTYAFSPNVVNGTQILQANLEWIKSNTTKPTFRKRVTRYAGGVITSLPISYIASTWLIRWRLIPKVVPPLTTLVGFRQNRQVIDPSPLAALMNFKQNTRLADLSKRVSNKDLYLVQPRLRTIYSFLKEVGLPPALCKLLTDRLVPNKVAQHLPGFIIQALPQSPVEAIFSLLITLGVNLMTRYGWVAGRCIAVDLQSLYDFHTNPEWREVMELSRPSTKKNDFLPTNTLLKCLNPSSQKP